MRIAGTLLLLGGFLLCISIVWAALGFLMIGFGLICLLIAERRNKRLAASMVSRSGGIATQLEPSLFPPQEEAQSPKSTTPRFDKIGTQREASRPRERKRAKPTGLTASRLGQNEPQWEPSRFRGRRNIQPTGSTAVGLDKIDLRGEPALESGQANLALVVSEEPTDRRQNTIDPYSYDAERWSSLVRNDADISRAAAALAPFGQKYVDGLAKAYLVLNDKDHLPIIFKKIAATLRKDSGKDTASATATESDPDTDLNSFALSKTQSLGVEQVVDVRSVRDGATDERLTSAAVRNPEVEEADTRRALEMRAVLPARREAVAMGPDDVEVFTDLLNSLDLGARASAKR